MNQTSLKQKSYTYDRLESINDKVNYPELSKVAAIYNNLAIKINRYRVIGDGGIWERISSRNACKISQSVPYQVLNAGQ